MSESWDREYKLIVTIVNRGRAKKMVEASRKAGAEGGTTLMGRGTGIHEAQKLFGICIDPEKEVVLTLVDGLKADGVLAAIVEAGQLCQPGFGIAFVLSTKQIAGIAHLLQGNRRDKGT